MHKILFLILYCVLMTGCCAKDNVEYLIQHPKYLQKKTLECQNNPTTPACQEVFTAAEIFVSLLNEHNSDPQAFGLKIINQEIKLVTLKQLIVNTKAQYKILLKRHAPDSERLSVQMTLNNLKKNYKEQSNHLKRLLAIVSATTVE